MCSSHQPLDGADSAPRTTNDAAERLREVLNHPLLTDAAIAKGTMTLSEVLDAALAAERRATVERFYNEALGLSWDDEHGNRVVAVDGLALIRKGIDEEAVR